MFLFATAPAALVSWGLSIASGRVAALQQPEGSLWHGKAAALLIGDSSERRWRYEDVRWYWMPARLAFAELAISAGIEDPNLRGSTELALRVGGIGLRSVNLEMPASALTLYLPRLSTAGLSGMLKLESPEFEVRYDGALAGAATLLWNQAGTSLSSVRSLGDFRARIAGVDRSVTFKVESSDGGPLRVIGEGSWSRAGGIAFAGMAQVRAGDEADFDSLLRLLGPRLGNGSYALSFP